MKKRIVSNGKRRKVLSKYIIKTATSVQFVFSVLGGTAMVQSIIDSFTKTNSALICVKCDEGYNKTHGTSLGRNILKVNKTWMTPFGESGDSLTLDACALEGDCKYYQPNSGGVQTREEEVV